MKKQPKINPHLCKKCHLPWKSKEHVNCFEAYDAGYDQALEDVAKFIDDKR